MPVIFPLITAGVSAYSAINAANKRKKAERGLESMDTPKYSPNQSILDYYSKALQKYNTNPTDSAEYKLQKQNIQQGTTQGISASNNRRGGGANVPALIQGQNNALLNAAVAGEQRKAQEFGVLGQATQMKSQEDSKAFNQNVIAPFEKNYNLLAMKAGNQAQVQNSATQNLYNNLNAAGTLANNDSGGAEWGKEYGSQGAAAYNWAKNNNMNFGQYRNIFNTVSKIKF